MNWQEALEEIQSVEFDVNLNVVSGTNAFFRAVAREPIVLGIYQEMRESGELREEILGRVYDLAAQEIDLRYENPNDTPLAVYLWLTYFGAPDFAAMTAVRVDQAPQCWYARKLSRRILEPPPSATGNHQVQETLSRPKVARSSSGNAKYTMAPRAGETWRMYRGKLVAGQQMQGERMTVSTDDFTMTQGAL